MNPSIKRITAIVAVCMVVSSMLPLGYGVVEAGSSSLDTDDALKQWGGKTTKFTASMFTRSGFEPTTKVVTHGSGLPGWYVKYDPSSSSAWSNLETWVDSSPDRRVLWHDQDTGLVLLAAPGAHIRRTGGVFGLSADGLSTRSFVEYVEVEQYVERVEPVTLESESSIETKHPVTRTADLVAKLNGGDYGTEDGATNGVAYSKDVNRTHMGDVKDAIAADQGTIPTSADGSGVTIAVLDTGANTADGLIFGNGTQGSTIRIDHGKNFITGSTINATSGNYSAIEDGNGHGTYVAARAAGDAAGNATLRAPAHDAEIAVGKVLGDDGSGSIQQIIRGLEWACSDPVNADVISMSLGSTTYSKALEDQIHACLESGDVSAITVAGGNSRWTTGRANLGSPADADGVIAVAATSTASPDQVETAYFSNTGDDGGLLDGSNGHTRGERPDVGTPGMETTVVVATANGATSNVTLSGTSMSTPDVASAVAVLVDEHPGLAGDHDALRERVLETASPAPHVGVTEIGHGLLNVSNLLTDTRPKLDQAAARTEQAKSRDQANFALTGRVGMFLRSRGVKL